MSRSCGENLGLDRHAEKGYVAEQVKQLVPCRFIGEAQFPVVQYAVFSGCEFGASNAEFFGKRFEFIFLHGFIDNDDRVVDISALDDSLICQRFHFAQKTECPAWREVLHELFLEIEKSGMLRAESGIFIIDHNRHPEAVQRQGNNIDAVFRVVIFYGFIDDQIVFRFILLDDSGAQKPFCKRQRTSVHDRRFGTAHFNPAIVDLQSVKGGKNMFGRMNFHVVDGNGCPPEDIDDVFNQGGNFRLVFKVGTYKTVSVIDRSRFEGDDAFLSGMQSRAL